MADWALLLAALPLALAAYGSAYAAWANARWPATGRRVKAGKARLHVAEAGDGAPVLCLHGASANGREFEVLAPHLPDFRLLMLDRPGYGHSSRPAGAERLERAAGFVAAALEAMDAGPVIVAAHSLGAATALRLAIDRPDLVRALVLISPASHPYPGPNTWHLRIAATPIWGALFSRLCVPLVGPLMAPRAIANTFHPAKPPEGYAGRAGVGLLMRPKTFRANAQDVTATKTEFEGQYFRYDEIACPALIVTADADRVVSPRIHARALARTLPMAELIHVPGAGHMPHHVRPDTVAAAIRRAAELASAQEAAA